MTCSCRAAQQGDELAPLQLIELHLIPPGPRTPGYRIGKDQSAGMTDILQSLIGLPANPRSAVGRVALLPPWKAAELPSDRNEF